MAADQQAKTIEKRCFLKRQVVLFPSLQTWCQLCGPAMPPNLNEAATRTSSDN